MQTLAGRAADFGELSLFRDVYCNTNEARAVVMGVSDYFCARAKPEPAPVGVADAESPVDVLLGRVQERLCNLGQVDVVGVGECVEFSHGNRSRATVKTEHFVHGGRPRDASARQIPIP